MKIRKVLNEKESKKNRKSEAYTFVETLAVLAISAILAAGTTFSTTKAIAAAKKATARNQIEQYYAALQCYFLDCGRFPTTEQGLAALWEKPVFYPVPENWNGPYLERKPDFLDPWGTDFKYQSAEDSTLSAEIPANMPFVLISYGADRLEGGEGNNADIVSWK